MSESLFAGLDPKVDVLIPVYNGSRTIATAVSSVQQQTFTNIRIIVIDDGSTDNTLLLLKEIRDRDSRVVILEKRNSGIVGALNAGLALGGGAMVARHDADDIAYPDRFQTQLNYLRYNPDCVGVSCGVRHIDEDGSPTGTFGRLRSPSKADPKWIPAREPYLIHPFLMFRRSAVEDIGGYRAVLHAEDSDLYWRLCLKGRLHNLPEILGDYRLHSHSISGASVENGRRMAISSQLAAISAVRSRAGTPDLRFNSEFAQALSSQGKLDRLVGQAVRDLSTVEQNYFEIAVAGKLLELAAYRPFELDFADCTYIRKTTERHLTLFSPENRAEYDRMVAGAGARLFHTLKFKEALALVPPKLYAQTALRYAIRLSLPEVLRRKLRFLLVGDEVVK